jgi:hypothetical protein
LFDYAEDFGYSSISKQVIGYKTFFCVSPRDGEKVEKFIATVKGTGRDYCSNFIAHRWFVPNPLELIKKIPKIFVMTCGPGDVAVTPPSIDFFHQAFAQDRQRTILCF